MMTTMVILMAVGAGSSGSFLSCLSPFSHPSSDDREESGSDRAHHVGHADDEYPEQRWEHPEHPEHPEHVWTAAIWPKLSGTSVQPCPGQGLGSPAVRVATLVTTGHHWSPLARSGGGDTVCWY